MKKFSFILSLIMALAIFALPMGAMAEPTTAQVIQIANPRITMDGQEVANLQGLAAQLALVEGSDVVQLIFDVFAGGVNANSAMLQFDGDTNIIGYVGGMSNAYSINANEVAQLFMDAFATESGVDMNRINNIVAMAENWTLPDDIENILYQHLDSYPVTEMGTITGESGLPLEYTQVTGDAMPMIIDILETAENDPLVVELRNLLDPEFAHVSTAQSLRDAGAGIDFVLLVGFDSTGDIMEIKADFTLTENGQSIGQGYSFYMFGDATDYNNVKINAKLTDMNSSFAITADMLIKETGLEATITEVADPEVATIRIMADFTDAADLFQIMANVDGPSPASVIFDYQGRDTANGYDFTLDMNANDNVDTVTIKAESSYALTDSDFNYDLTVNANDGYSSSTLGLNLYADAAGVYSAKLTAAPEGSEPVSIGLSLTKAAPAEGAYASAVLACEINDGYSAMNIAADIHLLTADVDTDNFYISPAAAINLLTMDDTQYNTAMTELNNVMNALGNTIMGAYPELFGY